jgi:hypothetical protein
MLKYEKIVAEDLNLGTGSVSVTNPAGGTMAGTKINASSIPYFPNGTGSQTDIATVLDSIDPEFASFSDSIDSINSAIGEQSNSINSISVSLNAISVAQSSGTIGFATKALMDADLAHDANTVALVTNDETPANNGSYLKIGASGAGSWQQSSFDRVALVETDVSTLNNTTYGVHPLKLTEGTGAVLPTIYKVQAHVSGKTYRIEVFAKADTRHRLQIYQNQGPVKEMVGYVLQKA